MPVSAKKQNDREARQARERLRAYQARQAVHDHTKKRRVRDNLIAGGVVVIVLALAVVLQLTYFSAGPGKPVASAKASATATPTPTAAATDGNSGDVPSKSLADGRTWTGTLKINNISLGISLDGAKAPQAVSSMISLAKKDFFNGTKCHRLTTSDGFKVLQCGDPKGDGTGGPGYYFGPVENAPSDGKYVEGTIAMARQSDNAYSNGSQFFIVYGDTTIPADSAGGYTVIGKVTSGLDTLKKDVTDKGVQGGGTDGTPVVTPTIDSLTLK
ncbi:peptidylprolyl isomerase [Humibacter sp. RRB41]|uniref:peptidylprolyl isomerase n=1 Tax=Humibacter sp. RRB41 TaxID=2919946 RepID=UPI001FA94B22|nr:peptidylprolyl isomerase [Humibacter sp. RRB41]